MPITKEMLEWEAKSHKLRWVPPWRRDLNLFQIAVGWFSSHKRQNRNSLALNVRMGAESPSKLRIKSIKETDPQKRTTPVVFSDGNQRPKIEFIVDRNTNDRKKSLIANHLKWVLGSFSSMSPPDYLRANRMYIYGKMWRIKLDYPHWIKVQVEGLALLRNLNRCSRRTWEMQVPSRAWTLYIYSWIS